MRTSVFNTFVEQQLPIQTHTIDVETLIRGEQNDISTNLEQILRDEGPVKWSLAIDVHFVRENIEGDKETTAYFRSEPAILMNSTQLQMQIEESITRFSVLAEAFTDQGSGWEL